MYKLEKKFGKYAIHNLSMYLVIGYAIGFFVNMISPQLYYMLTFNPYAIMNGQIWRIFTWVLTLPSSDNFIFVLIMLFFYYSLGTTLENTWGAFRYNLYIFSGALFTVIGGIVLYVIMVLSYKTTGSLALVGDFEPYALGLDTSYAYSQIGGVIGECVNTYYINMSIFLAFAMTYPDMQVMLYFIIPLKIKWLGVLYAVSILYEVIYSSWVNRVIIIVSLLNFLIFFFATRNYNRISPSEIKRKKTYRKSMYEAQRNSVYENGARHKCAICGRTELDDPELTFRYCSKCTGGKEYCQNHLFTHEHK